MSENLFVIDSTTSEGGSKNIIIYEEQDFIQQCKITKYTLSDDNKYIDIEVKNLQGKVCNSRMYLPKEKSEYATEEKYNNAVRIFLGNMANIARKFKGEDYKVEGRDAIEVVTKVIRDITPFLNSKTVYVLFELTENDKGIFTRIGSFSPFGEKESDLKVSVKQKTLLHKKNNMSKFDKDTPPTNNNSDSLPF